MVVMTLVASIYLFIMRRFKGEKRIVFFLSLLLIETMIMGMASLKKMYLYQSIKGATVLRYYVEWFDYFLLITLSLGILFLIKRFAFQKLLNTLFILGLLSFTLIASIDIDHLVASANIEKFKNTPEKLDKYALGKLSVDALPAVKGMNGVQKKLLIIEDLDETVIRLPPTITAIVVGLTWILLSHQPLHHTPKNHIKGNCHKE